ncbi:hypothetical protein KI387_028905, partial [Taxus chinensis]
MMCMVEMGSVAPVAMAETENLAKEDGNLVRVKFLCSFGGSILPRPSDGKLRYAGGDTRIVSVARGVNYRELMAKLRELYEEETLSLKYQQPDDDLDALVSVLSDEDVCNMMDEYDRLEVGDGVCSRLRLFLFAAGDQQQQNLMSNGGSDDRDAEQRYVQALNSVVEISRQQSENNNNSIYNNNNHDNINSSSNNSSVVGNGSEAGIAQHVSMALPVSLMKPFLKGGGSAASSPPSSPSHHHPHHHKQVSASDQYYQRQISHQHHLYAHNSNLVQQEQFCDIQGQSHQYMSYSDVQGQEYVPTGQSEFNRGQSELNRHNQYGNHPHIPWRDTFQNIQGSDLPLKVQPEVSSRPHHHLHHHHHHESELHQEVAAVPGVEIPSKGKIDVDAHHLHSSHRVPSYHEIPGASVVEFPLQGQSEVDSYHQHLPSPHELQQNMGVEVPFKFQPEGGSRQQHFPLLQSDAGSHLQRVLTNSTPTWREISGLPGVEYPQKGQSNIGSGIHSGFVNGREYKQSLADTYVTHIESHGNSQQSEQLHVNVQSEVAVSAFSRGMVDGRLHNIQSHQCDLHCPTCSWQHEMPLTYHQAAQNSSDEIHHDQEHNSKDHLCEFAWSNSGQKGSFVHLMGKQLEQFQHIQNDNLVQKGTFVHPMGRQSEKFQHMQNNTLMQKGTFVHPVGRQSEQFQHIQNDNKLPQGAFNTCEYVYRDHHALIHSNLLQNNAFLHSMAGQVEHQLSQNDIEIEGSWNASYYASGPQISHDFGCTSHSANILDFHLASTPAVHEVNSSNNHERYLQNQYNVQVPWACDEYANQVNYVGNQLRGNLAPLNSHPSSNILGENHVTWPCQPHFAEEDDRFEAPNPSHLQKTFEGNSPSQRQYALVQSRQNISEVLVPHSYSEQSLPYSDQYGKDEISYQNVKDYGQYCPVIVVSEDLSLQVLNVGRDQSMLSAQKPDQLITFQDGKEKAKDRVLHGMNDQVEILIDGQANGAHSQGESMQNSFEQNNLWGHYHGLHPDDVYHIKEVDNFLEHASSDHYETRIHQLLPAEFGAGHGKFVDVNGKECIFEETKAFELENTSHSKLKPTMIESHLDDTFGIHLQANNGQGIGLVIGGEDESADSVLGKRYEQDIERPEDDYILRGMNTLNVSNFPDSNSKLSDVFEKNTIISDSNSNHFMGSHFTRKIEDLKFLTIEPVKGQTSYQSEIGITCVSDAFATENNQILSSSAFSHAITSVVALVSDQPTVSRSSVNFPPASSSSPQRSNEVACTTLPIYDQSPANSTNVALPENLWSETEKGRKPSEFDKNAILENKGMMPITEKMAVEHNSAVPEVPKQDQDVDNRMHENHLKSNTNVICWSTSRPMDSTLHGPSIPCSSVVSASQILGKRHSAGDEKEVVTGMAYKEVKDEDVFPTSDMEENIPQQEVTENNSLELIEGAHSGSVDKARKASAEAEAQALAKGLQMIRNVDLEEIRELGSGTYGTVYHGKWKGSDVAIKRIKASCFEGRPSEQERLIADFWKEASILGNLHHPNVISFYGVVRDGPGATLATVTEFMVNGSLKQVLRKKDRTIDRRKRLILAMDASFGMEYLHEKNVVHFDLKCENLLVNMRDPHRPVCKIGDMGLSKVKHQTLVSGGVRGTLPWMAPELLSGRSGVSDKIDVYSFGIVMWELLTGDEPYANMHCGSII